MIFGATISASKSGKVIMELAFASDTQLKSAAFLGALFLENISTMLQLSMETSKQSILDLSGYFYRCLQSKELVFAQNSSNVDRDLALPLDVLRIHLQININQSLLNSSLSHREGLLLDLSNQAFRQLYVFSNNAEFQNFVELNASNQLELDEMLGNMRKVVNSQSPSVH